MQQRGSGLYGKRRLAHKIGQHQNHPGSRQHERPLVVGSGQGNAQHRSRDDQRQHHDQIQRIACHPAPAHNNVAYRHAEEHADEGCRGSQKEGVENGTGRGLQRQLEVIQTELPVMHDRPAGPGHRRHQNHHERRKRNKYHARAEQPGQPGFPRGKGKDFRRAQGGHGVILPFHPQLLEYGQQQRHHDQHGAERSGHGRVSAHFTDELAVRLLRKHLVIIADNGGYAEVLNGHAEHDERAGGNGGRDDRQRHRAEYPPRGGSEVAGRLLQRAIHGIDRRGHHEKGPWGCAWWF